MKVILLVSVPGTGKPGATVDVHAGFARNFLFPRNLAIPATPELLAKSRADIARRQAAEAKSRADIEALFQGLQGKAIRVTARAHGEKLFGSIGRDVIAEALAAQLNIDLAPEAIHLTAPIRTVGRHTIPLRLHTVEGAVILEVHPNA